jgi:hypothetical protein
LAVHKFLIDVEVLHVEEAFFANSSDEDVNELALALRRVELGEINCNEFSPVEVLLYKYKSCEIDRNRVDKDYKLAFVSETYW